MALAMNTGKKIKERKKLKIFKKIGYIMGTYFQIALEFHLKE